MCGIHAAIYATPDDSSSANISPNLRRCLCSRGPDHTGSVRRSIATSSGSGGDKGQQRLSVTLTSTVLALRGDHVVKQPLIEEDGGDGNGAGSVGSVLCWNGEAWRIRGEAVRGNDGEAVLALLAEARRRPRCGASDGAENADGEGENADDAVLEALRQIEGPFAFVFLDQAAKRIYYGRDRLGRRSLLRTKSGLLPFALSSVADVPLEGWVEVEADGCYMIDLDDGDAFFSAGGPATKRFDWARDDTFSVASIGAFNMDGVPPAASQSLTLDSKPVQDLHARLLESLRPRVLGVPMPPLAAPTEARCAVLFSGGLDCTVLARLAHDLIPVDQDIDLLNVAFENPRIAAQHPDCSLDELYEKCPDRITARASFAELSRVCPRRRWRLVTVNVPFAETAKHRADIIRLMHPHNTEMDLSIACALYFAARGQGTIITSEEPEEEAPQRPCSPRSPGAAQAGIAATAGAGAAVMSTTARVLLSGLGADELFGGYSRHGAAFSAQGYPGLAQELRLDVGRLGKRNLGRDDRVMAHWGREVRFPFLDEPLVRWAMALPAWDKCDFASSSAAGGGLDPEKRVLRLLARSLGMEAVAREKKRAIQFGARTAKMHSGRVKGTTLISAWQGEGSLILG